METKSAIPITVRLVFLESFTILNSNLPFSQLEAIIRVSESIAKLSLSTTATENHVNEAIRLFNYSTMSAVQAQQGLHDYILSR